LPKLQMNLSDFHLIL